MTNTTNNNGNGPATHVVANQSALGGRETNDGDGPDDATLLPELELDRLYYTFEGMEYIAGATTKRATTCNVGGTNYTSVGSGDYPFPGKLNVGTGASIDNTVAAGAKIDCNATSFFYGDNNAGREITLQSIKAARQYVYPEITASTGNESRRAPLQWANQSQNSSTVLTSQSLTLSAQGYSTLGLLYATLSTNESGAWQNKSVYGSPMYLSSSTNWTWSNFTWRNDSIAANTVVSWRIYYNDTFGRENVTGIMNFSVLPTVSITLIRNSVDFGTMTQSQTNDTSDNVPLPFEIRNDGNVKVNITVNATDLWSTATNPSQYYKAAANASTEGITYNTACTLTNYTNMPSVQTLFMCFLDWLDASDQAVLELNVTVPIDEGAGAKNSTVTILATQA
jgi:hypothetical protein